MKRFKSILRLQFLILLLFIGGGMKVFATNELVDSAALAHADSAIHIGLLTCQPGQEVYSIYGHTAIHYINTDKAIDVAINYGTFDMNQPHFVLNFVLGRTDYMMSIAPFYQFCAEYNYEERGVVEQTLDLPPAEKLLFVKAIEENSRYENLTYRYNFYYNNCTTRARDIVLGQMAGQTRFDRTDGGPTLRQMIHQYNGGRPWLRMGTDLLLGFQADRPSTVGEQQFLPNNLMDDFDKAVVEPGGRKLVSETRTIIKPFAHIVGKEFPLSPTACAIILAVLIVLLTLLERKLHKTFWLLDLVLLLLIGACGMVLAVMMFSQHPTVRLNLQMLLLNPVALICLIPVVRCGIKGKSHWFWAFYFICLVAFFVGNFIQSYAEGMNILALSLLFRSGMSAWKKTTNT